MTITTLIFYGACMLIGAFAGLFAAALCVAASRDDR